MVWISGCVGFSLGCFIASWACRRKTRALHELKQRAELAERNLRHLGDVANEVAHEIKNPLTAILCSVETLNLILGPQLEDSHRKTLKYMRDYGDHLLRLVTDFLDLSRAETDRLDVHKERILVAEVVSSLLGLLNAQAMERRITLHAEVDEGLKILFDGRHFKQVLFNLLHNAIKFTPPGGEVRVRACQLPGVFKALIAVEDTGAGISKELTDRIFERYWTTRRAKGGENAGVGLGLALCRMLAEINGERLSVESVEGQGTTFSFTAPLDVVALSKPVEVRKSEAFSMLSPLEGRQVLVMKDASDITDTVAPLIEAWGGIVQAVTQVEDLLRHIQTGDFDTVMIEEWPERISDKAMVAKEILHSCREQGAMFFVSDDHFAVEVGSNESLDTIGVLSKPYSGSQLLAQLTRPR